MFKKICLFLAFAVSVQSYGYGGGFGGGFSGGSNNQLAVNTRHSVRYIPTPSSGYIRPTNVEIHSNSPPLNLFFRSVSSPVSVRHVHVPSPGSFQETSSVDGAHVRVHTVTRPIIQELREIITPRRLISQHVLPVQEQIQTIIARGVQSGGGGFSGSGQFF